MRIFSLAFFALTLSLVAGNAAAQRVTVTMAGNGIVGFNGDGSAGYITDVNQPQDVCVDAAKNIYFIIWPLAGSNFIKHFHKKGIIRRCVAVTDLQGNEDLYQVPIHS